ncbi:FtsB family cell division protein [Mycetocola zhujimingii]|uniref:FtsB family cell division protein n=1 Tax=Mycetocola zhujimingii TaxID=2079792 RepID=UPI001304B20F|nr:septum formation initiator family protein [Mycetocola zhujimingii]
MAKRPNPTGGRAGGAARTPQPGVPVPQSEAGNWLRGIRFSGFSLLMMGLVVLGVIVVGPNLKAYIEQRQQIAALQESVDQSAAEIAEVRDERERWNDSTYVMTQARDRLYYVNPGEISFIVINDVDAGLFGDDEPQVTDSLTETKIDWAQSMLSSLVSAGYADVVSGSGQG